MDTENPDDAPVDVREDRSNWTIKSVREETRVRFRRHARKRGMASHELIEHCADLLDAEDARTEIIGPTIEQNGTDQGRTLASSDPTRPPSPAYRAVEDALVWAQIAQLTDNEEAKRELGTLAADWARAHMRSRSRRRLTLTNAPADAR